MAWRITASRVRGNRPGVWVSWLTRSCRTRAEGRAWVLYLRARGWCAAVDRVHAK